MTESVRGEFRICPSCGREGEGNFCLNDGAPLEAKPSTSLVGRTLHQRYQIDSVIGGGGMGTIYKATHLHLGTPLAIKVINTGVLGDDPDAAARFQREAKIINALIHPNIVRALDFGMDEGKPYLVMDFVNGQSLDDLIRDRKRLDERTAVGIALQICDALAFAHKSGVLHRDLKPGNIMLVQSDNKPSVRLLDFGLAKIVDQAGGDLERLTKSGSFVGTPEYMSPEQCLGKISELDVRTDIYSLGCILYEALTGQVPISGSNVLDTLHKQVKETPKRFAELGITKISPALEEIVFRALEKSPDQRQASMNELRHELEKTLGPRFLEAGQHLAAPPDAQRGGVPFAWWQLAAAALAISAAVAAAVLTSQGGHRTVAPIVETEKPDVPPPSSPVLSPHVEPMPEQHTPLVSTEAHSEAHERPPATVPAQSHNEAHPTAKKVAVAIATPKPAARIAAPPPAKAPPRTAVLTEAQVAEVGTLEDESKTLYAQQARNRADPLLKKAMELRAKEGPSKGLVEDMLNLCQSAYLNHDDEQLRHCTEQAEQTLRAAHVPHENHLNADVATYRGWSFLRDDKFAAAEGKFRSALASHEGSGQNSWVSSDLKGLRLSLMGEKKYAAALDVAGRSATYVTPNSGEDAQLSIAMAHCNLELNNLPAAEAQSKRGYDLASRLRNKSLIANALEARAWCSRRRKNFAHAADLYQQEASIWQQLHDGARAETARKNVQECRQQQHSHK